MALRRALVQRYCDGVRRLRPWMIVSAAWIVPAAFAVLNRVAQARLRGWETATTRELLFEFGDWLLYAFLTPFVFAISKRWPLARPRLGRRIFFHLFMSIMFCVAWATCGQVWRMFLMRQVVSLRTLIEWVSWIFITLPFGVAVYLCVVGIEHATRYFIDAR